MKTEKAGQVTILVVDDDAIDRRAIRRSFKKEKLTNPIVEATDGAEALELLRGESDDASVPDPFLILLDLNMPRVDGHEFLEKLRADPKLCKALVFVLTTSASKTDKEKAYRHNVAGYLTKRDGGADLLRKARLIDLYSRTVDFPRIGA